MSVNSGAGVDGAEGAGADAVRQWRELAPGAVLLDGFHAVKHALRFGADVTVLVAVDRGAALALAEELAPDLVERVARMTIEVPSQTVKSLVPRLHPTGVAALAVRRARTANHEALYASSRPAPVVVLEEPRNLGNVGAVVRLAAGIGATGVVTTGTADPWHPNAVRGGAGLHYATAVERLTLETLPAGPLYVLDPEGEDLRTVTLPDDALLAFGTERHGVSPELRSRADHLLALPMQPKVSSYNLATSVAMTLYHWLGARATD